MLKTLEDRGVSQVSKSRNPWAEEAQDHQDEGKERENPTIQEKRQSRDQADGNSPDSKFQRIKYIDKVLDVTVVHRGRCQQPRPSTDSGDSRGAVSQRSTSP